MPFIWPKLLLKIIRSPTVFKGLMNLQLNYMVWLMTLSQNVIYSAKKWVRPQTQRIYRITKKLNIFYSTSTISTKLMLDRSNQTKFSSESLLRFHQLWDKIPYWPMRFIESRKIFSIQLKIYQNPSKKTEEVMMKCLTSKK